MTQTELESEKSAARTNALQQWFLDLDFQDSGPDSMLSPVSGDASFRRYFRAYIAQQPYILVDAPPDKENSQPFVTIAQKFLQLGINTPVVQAMDLAQGFMCLSDFGDVLLWQKLDQAQKQVNSRPSASALYRLAFKQLLMIQNCVVDQQFPLPKFDKAHLYREMGLFQQWFCQDLLGLDLTDSELALIESSFQFLIDSALAQEQVCVHRDYHSRNLMYQEGEALGVIDFQDAVLGPVTYDLVSLLKDCYISWPRQEVNDWAIEYARMALHENIITELDEADFLRAFDLMGVQRHLKAVGIFARLYLRDGRLNYLADIPRTLNYIRAVAKEHAELKQFSAWLEESVVPHVDEKIDSILQGAKQ